MTTSSDLYTRIAGAPISWGVCEAPDWGIELPADRVLREMTGLGLRATELGPTGYLGADPAAVQATLEQNGLRLVGGFLPVVMHVAPDVDLSDADAAMSTLAAAGADTVVFAAQSADGSYDRKIVLTDDEWQVLADNLTRLTKLAESHGLHPTLHPHVGTAVETRDAVLRLLAVSDVDLCLDTGHLLIGGMDPAELLDVAAPRIAHVHLKDVRREVAATVAAETVSYIEAVRAGLYTPLGRGDVDITNFVRTLEASGYRGWYVLEQDAALHTVPAEGEGPVDDVATSLDFLRDLA